MSYLLGVAGGCMAAILILICLCIYAVKSKKCCFKGKSKAVENRGGKLLIKNDKLDSLNANTGTWQQQLQLSQTIASAQRGTHINYAALQRECASQQLKHFPHYAARWR